jgi:GTP pyrophosphokinase
LDEGGIAGMKATTTESGIGELLSKVGRYLTAEELSVVQEAHRFASLQHAGQLRKSGEPYVEHPVQTAIHLADLQLDAATIVAGLLHDVVEDTNGSFQEVEDKFGLQVAKLVDGVTKLTRIERSSSGDDRTHLHAESLRKMLIAMAEDVRVVLIKLADRLHNMQTLSALSPAKRKTISRETLDIFTPLAHRLGMWEMKWRLEDMAFRHLEPGQYRKISRMLAAKRGEREGFIERVGKRLGTALERNGVTAEVKGRVKHIYSIYRKLQSYTAQGKELSQIYDLYALRVLVETKNDCYNALGVVHDLWRPLPGQFDDYIANAKENMYQSLHTAVMCEGGAPLEIQIRTYDMHRTAEFGVAAHWSYKEGGAADSHFDEKMAWLRQLLEWQRDVSEAEEFVESVKTDIFRDQVFVYTPKGDIKELPAGATPLDFAFRIHTDLGLRCIGTKVNGRLVSLDYKLNNGDTVEVLISKSAKGPSLDWLNPDLGYVRTASAKEKIRQWFRRQERTANIKRGKELLLVETKRLDIDFDEAEIAKRFKFEFPDEMYAALGSGGLGISQVISHLTSEQEKPQLVSRPPKQSALALGGNVEVMGVGDLMTRIAQCCNPIPGDEIVGYITRGRGITVHRKDCPNVLREDEKERLVDVQWGAMQQLYSVPTNVIVWDRVGLLRDISTLVSEEGVNMSGVATRDMEDGRVTISLTLYTKGIGQLSRIFRKMEGVRGVISVSRNTSVTPPLENK